MNAYYVKQQLEQLLALYSSHRGTAASRYNLQVLYPLRWGYLLVGDKPNARFQY